MRDPRSEQVWQPNKVEWRKGSGVAGGQMKASEYKVFRDVAIIFFQTNG